MKSPFTLRFLPIGGLAAVMYSFTVASSYSAVAMSWAGGSGAPLSVNFAAPVMFDVTTASGSGFAPIFVMVGIGNLFGNSKPDATGLVFSINGGLGQAITSWNSGFVFGSVAMNDVYFYSTALPGLSVGDVVTVTAGSLTGTTSHAGAGPSATSAEMFIIDGSNGTRIGAVAVPEPSAMLFGGLGLLGLLLRRR